MEAEKFSQEKNHRKFYTTLNAVYSPRSRNSHPVRSKNGELLTGSEAIENGWVEHFSDFLNQPSDVDLSIVNEIDQLPVNKPLNRPIEQQELEQALKNTKPGKSPGADGVFPKLLMPVVDAYGPSYLHFSTSSGQVNLFPQIISMPSSQSYSRKATEVIVVITEGYPY